MVARAARSSRRRCCCARGSAVRRSASTCGCTRPGSSTASTRSRSRRGSGRSSPRCRTTSPMRGRLRVPDRVASAAMPAVNAGGVPWRDGEQHKRDFARTFRHHAPFLSVARDHGEGEVVLDHHGQPSIRWSLDDEVDRRLFVRANVELARLHHAIGAPEIRTLHAEPSSSGGATPASRSRTSCTRIEQAALRPDRRDRSSPRTRWARAGWARIPADSVADGRGQLHDVPGVWIGDASAFPTAPRGQPDGLDHVARPPDGRPRSRPGSARHRDRLGARIAPDRRPPRIRLRTSRSATGSVVVS